MEQNVFETVEECIELSRAGKPCDTGFEYVYNCEEVEFEGNEDSYEFDIDGDIEAQLDEIHNFSSIKIVQEYDQPFDEFTRTICPAYTKK